MQRIVIEKQCGNMFPVIGIDLDKARDVVIIMGILFIHGEGNRKSRGYHWE